MDLAIDLMGGENLNTLRRLASRASLQIEVMGMQRTDDFSIADQSVGQRTLAVRTPVMRGKYSAVTLAEYRERLRADNKAAALPKRNSANAAKIDHCCN